MSDGNLCPAGQPAMSGVYALEMVPQVEEEPVGYPALTTGTLDHCAEHLETSADIFKNGKYPMTWFDDHTFVVELPDGRFLFRIVARNEAIGVEHSTVHTTMRQG
ncbi:hypothetical protein ACIA8C_19560 [Nocardia sp. NPDC051321]|uniref:hypothetical protein n=1 Tax=Nocardia sp. NPDC051321 TaxID=3364323 RepID=UPI003795F589